MVVMHKSRAKIVNDVLPSDKWQWGMTFKMVMFCSVVGTLIDIVVLSTGDSEYTDAGQFGFVSSVRVAQRVKTPRTYTSERGPLYEATIEKVDSSHPLRKFSGRGVGDLEDSIGGLISGPTKMFRHGEIFVTKRINPATPHDIQVSGIARKKDETYWTNGKSDHCVDREIFMSAERYPAGLQDDGHEPDSNELWFGYVKHQCGEELHYGYITTVFTASHGNALSGHIYSVEVNITDDQLPYNATLDPRTHHLETVDIGSFVENRSYGNRLNDIIHLALLCSPLVIWSIVKSRMSKALIVVHTSVVKSDATFQLRGYADFTSINIWCWPLMYILGIILTFQSSNIELNDLYVIRQVAPDYLAFVPNYFGCMWLLIGQEAFAWMLYTASHFMTIGVVRNLNKSVIFGYQRFRNGLIMLLAFNICSTLLVLADFFIPDVDFLVVYIILAVGTFLSNGIITIWGIMNHTYQESCDVVEANFYCYINMRGIAILLANTHNDMSVQLSLVKNEQKGASFRGELVDAMMIAQPDMFFEAVKNGSRIEIKLLEAPTENYDSPVHISVAGSARFEITRHWKLQGSSTAIIQ